MSHMLKDVAVLFDGSEAGQHILDVAADLAATHHAHLIGICANVNPDVIPEDGFARGGAAHDVMERHRSAVEAHLLQAGKCLARGASRRNVNAEFRVISNTNAGSEVALHSLYCDLLVVGGVQAQAMPSTWSPEQTLRRTGVPVLIVPPTWGDNAVGRRIVVAWNASRQARRAIADALPLLVAAHWVELLLVDPERSPGQHGPEPGADMAAYLARHGVEIEVKRLATRENRSVAETIADHALDIDADLLVIGAYSHGRLSEAVFGGVTRSLLSEIPVPLFVSH